MEPTNYNKDHFSGDDAMKDRFKPESGTVSTLEPLDLAVDDDKLVGYLKNLEKKAKEHWDSEEINLTKRREQNLKYLFGRQLKGKKLKRYQSEYIDNIVYEFEKTLKSLALSKLPDLVVKEGGANPSEAQKLTAELLSKVEDLHLNQRETKKLLGMMFKHMPVYLISALKYRWDTSKKKIGDIVEEVIPPDHLLLDHTALTSNPDEMLFVTHFVEKTGREWAMLFPKKEDAILKYIQNKHPSLSDESDDVVLSQKLRIPETWFDWFDKAEDFNPEEPQFNYSSGVAWRLGNELLGKTKNPNWDYEGHQVMTINGEVVDPEMMEQMMMGPIPGMEIKQVFNNYFEFPRKPFIFMTYDQFLRSAIDETSRIEQAIPGQKSIDETEGQIDYMVKNHKGKHVFSGIDKKDVEKIDFNDPDQDISLPSAQNVRDAHAFIQPVMPPGEMFVHARDKRERVFAKVGTHGATRGEVTTQVATTNQIAREADFTKSDDLVDDTILHVATELAKARLHMMKLRYTSEHFQRIAGLEEGKYLHLRLTNDSIEDGMEIEVTASTTDKLKAERNASNMAQIGLIDPLTFYQDMGLSDPEGRAEKMFWKEMNPEMYYQKYILKKDISEIASGVINQNMPQPMEGQPVQQPAVQPSPQDTSNIATQPQGGQGMIGRMIGGARDMLGV